MATIVGPAGSSGYTPPPAEGPEMAIEKGNPGEPPRELTPHEQQAARYVAERDQRMKDDPKFAERVRQEQREYQPDDKVKGKG